MREKSEAIYFSNQFWENLPSSSCSVNWYVSSARMQAKSTVILRKSEKKEAELISIDFFIFILLPRETDRGAIQKTNPDSLKSCLCLRIFLLSFVSYFFNLLLVRFQLAGKIIAKHLIQRRNTEAGVGVEPSTLQSWQF